MAVPKEAAPHVQLDAFEAQIRDGAALPRCRLTAARDKRGSKAPAAIRAPDAS